VKADDLSFYPGGTHLAIEIRARPFQFGFGLVPAREDSFQSYTVVQRQIRVENLEGLIAAG
jgi:hypothetical protein